VIKELDGTDAVYCIGTQVTLITGNVFNLLVMVNCAANFILYSAFSTKFRATFSHLFCACGASSLTSPDDSSRRRCCRCCCCRWPVHTYSSAAGRDVNPGNNVGGRYASLPAGGRASSTARSTAGRARGRFATSKTFSGDIDDVPEEDEGLCSMTHDKQMVSSQSGVEEDRDDDLHITSL